MTQYDTTGNVELPVCAKNRTKTKLSSLLAAQLVEGEGTPCRYRSMSQQPSQPTSFSQTSSGTFRNALHTGTVRMCPTTKPIISYDIAYSRRRTHSTVHETECEGLANSTAGRVFHHNTILSSSCRSARRHPRPPHTRTKHRSSMPTARKNDPKQKYSEQNDIQHNICNV